MKKIYVYAFDDDAQELQTLEITLGFRGCDISKFLITSPERWDAILREITQLSPPDCALIDMAMDPHGSVIAEVLRNLPGWKDIPLIYISAHEITKSDPPAIPNTREYKVSRPIRPEDLVDFVKAVVSGKL
jgi:CheY-like chemotaxis protein